MYGTLSAVLGVIILAALGGRGKLGSWREKVVYSFEYGGKKAVLKYDDIRFGVNRYYFLIDGKDKLNGKLTTDDGKEISLYGHWYSSLGV